MAISETCYATNDNHEHAVLRKWLGELNVVDVLIQIDAEHAQKPFSAAPGAVGRISSDGQDPPEDAPPPDRQTVPGEEAHPCRASQSPDHPRQ